MGRPRKTLPFVEAKRYVQKYCPAKSRERYYEWIDKEGPPYLPKYPFRSYQDDWISWNDFLGTQNKFGNEKIKWRPYWEAVRFVQTLGLKTEKEWLAYADTGQKPGDIPKFPEAQYKEWVGKGWPTWLGKTAVSKIVSAEKGREIGIYALVHENGDPANVITLVTDLHGKISFIEARKKIGFSVLAVYEYEEDLMEQIHYVICKHSSEYYGQASKRLVRNLNELRWDLDRMLLMVKI